MVRGIIYLEQGSVKVVEANGEKFAVKYLGVKNKQHIFFRNSGANKVYRKPLWEMSPDNRYVQANGEGFIDVEELDIKLNSNYAKSLAREVRGLI